ncbi:hypothetical protein EIK77_002634 [Talaromyces pinophilus]|nr:hypothetical protein EIK77_002634 [Talaromyces pinophilus]
MMNSNILSRMLPPAGSPSIYEAMRHDDEASGNSDIEERAAMALDEENLQESLHNYDPDDAGNSQITTQSTAFLGQGRPRKLSDTYSTKAGGNGVRTGRSRWLQHLSPRVAEADEGGDDDDVPASLLIEGHDLEDMPKLPAPPSHGIDYHDDASPGAGPSSTRSRKRWESPRNRRKLDQFLPTPILDPRQQLSAKRSYISDPEIQTISWQQVVSRLMNLRDSNPSTAAAISARHRRFMGSQSKQRMDAHDIANRLMRKENYLIALFNKDILDLTLPVPFLRNRQLFSRTLEWNLNLCILDYVFNEQGQVRPLFLRDTHRRALSEGLRRRFIFAGVMNIFVAPFIVVYFMMHYFFRYFNEYQKNPSQIGSRQYTPLAEWKFREFNELWHLFQRRINMSYPFASRYVDQFPKDKTVQISSFVAFIAGALASVLALASLLDPELFLGFEITQDRTVLFYLGLFGSVWAIARGLVPEETDVFDPEFALLEVTNFTHYRPNHWAGRLHSDEVRQEFAMLYQMKIVIFLEEILSMIFTPFVLWFSLPKCSDRLIDFFREFTVHVDGLGYVCSFAVFDFKKDTQTIPQGRVQSGPAGDLRDDYFSTKDGKMLASYYGFLDSYGANPKAAAAPGTRRRFHPPPPFPALGSTHPADATPRAERWDQMGPRHSPMVGPQTRHSTLRGSRMGGVPGYNSPFHSMLLDPHHQPSASALRSAPMTGAQSRFRPSRAAPSVGDAMDDVKELSDVEASKNGAGQQSGRIGDDSTGAVATSDNNLEGSWRMNLAGEADDSDSVEEGDEVEAIVNGPGGVLGLIQQFQKANNEGRAGGATVNI